MAAPIALFVYNRLSHTKRTVELLQRNTLAQESDLHIFGEKPGSTPSKEIEEVRTFIRGINGFKSITIVEREPGFGLDQAIIAGVTEIINKYGSIIVLEDDILTSPFFLKYMNDALNLYGDSQEVMHIGGFMFPINSDGLPQTFFCHSPFIWGWGTWKRAWDYFNPDLGQTLPILNSKMIYKFNINGSFDYWTMIQKQRKLYQRNTWDILWYLTVFIRNGYCLLPANSLTNNIGRDGSGHHEENLDCFNVNISDKSITYFERTIAENHLAIARISSFLSQPLSNSYSNKFMKIFNIKKLLH